MLCERCADRVRTGVVFWNITCHFNTTTFDTSKLKIPWKKQRFHRTKKWLHWNTWQPFSNNNSKYIKLTFGLKKQLLQWSAVVTSVPIPHLCGETQLGLQAFWPVFASVELGNTLPENQQFTPQNRPSKRKSRLQPPFLRCYVSFRQGYLIPATSSCFLGRFHNLDLAKRKTQLWKWLMVSTPPKFNIAPEKWWLELEDYFPFGMAYFQESC